jgi:hypothetical protein
MKKASDGNFAPAARIADEDEGDWEMTLNRYGYVFSADQTAQRARPKGA